MSAFFQLFAGLGALGLLGAALLGQFGRYYGIGSQVHLLVGLAAAIFAVSVHCLIFAIFTGSGKDTRLLTEDLDLQKDFLKRAKGFKRTIFPPALYAIFFLLVTTSLGGFLSAGKDHGWLSWGHGIAAWLCLFYNLKVFWVEIQGVSENQKLIAEINVVAMRQASVLSASEPKDEVNPGAVEHYEWETHVYALGKFLVFMSYNAWLPYIYLRFIVRNLMTPFWPFLGASLIFLFGGYYLRWRYRSHRPRFDSAASAKTV